MAKPGEGWRRGGRAGPHTYREENGEEVIRLISARKTTPLERRAYEKNYESSE